MNQEAKENENSANLKEQEIKAEYNNGNINNNTSTSLSELMMEKVDQQQKQQQQQLLQEQIEFNNSIDSQSSQVFNSYNNINSNSSSSIQKPMEAKNGGECTANGTSEQLLIIAGKERQSDNAQCDKEGINEGSNTVTNNINNSSTSNKSFSLKSTVNQSQQQQNQQQQQQQFLPPPISVIVTHQQQQQQQQRTNNENKNNKQMDDDCWNIGGVNSEIGGNVSSMLIRDEFIFQPSHCGVSPPPPATTSVIGGGGRNDGGVNGVSGSATDFLYDLSAPLLEDTFLTSMHNSINNHSPLDNIPCSSTSLINCPSSASVSSSSAFLELQHNHDGSVGVSPCSSSTHNSSSPDDYTLFLAQQQHQQQQHLFHQNNIKQQFPHLLAPAIENVEILRPIPQLLEDHSIAGQTTIDMHQQQQYAFLVQQHAQNSLQAMFSNNGGEQQQHLQQHLQQQQTLNITQQRRRKEENRNEMFEQRRNSNHSEDDEDEEDDEGDEDMEEERGGRNNHQVEMPDVKPSFILGGNNNHSLKSPTNGGSHFNPSATFLGEEGCIGDYTLSPPPPPLTPPSKTRSKMHDLALKHRLISSQVNLRGNGTIQLSMEEKKTLVQEGFPVPTKLPLMREEEEALKIVRRKIKNKLSAQESRRKRKEYMDMLEKRVHAYFADNNALRQKLRQLEASNRFLLVQLQQKTSAEVGVSTSTSANEEQEHSSMNC
uniref:BZIP domain-containing protein n=1 Tax=Meloidogyne incognita TaxID=6306 RepID=A0A914KSA3_MELIC